MLLTQVWTSVWSIGRRQTPGVRSANTGRKSVQSSMTYYAAESSFSAAIVLPLHCLGEKFHHHFHHLTGQTQPILAHFLKFPGNGKTAESLENTRFPAVFTMEQVKGIEPSCSAWEAVYSKPAIRCAPTFSIYTSSTFPPCFPPVPSRRAIPWRSAVSSLCW